MRILLTGASGFLGTRIVREAMARGHELLLLVRAAPGVEFWKRSGAAPGSLALSVGTMEKPGWREIEQFQPECCIHAAWISTPGVYLESPENALHLEWSHTFLGRLIEQGCPAIVGLGTCAEYGASAEPLQEDTSPIQPASVYARAKDALRRWLETRPSAPSRVVAWARIFHPYGVGEHRDRLCSYVIRELSAGRRVNLRTPHCTKDYIHVGDVAAAVLRIVEARYRGVINVGAGRGISVAELAGRIARLMARPELVAAASDPAMDSQDRVVADIRRLASLGWKPQVPLESGLQGLIEELAS